MKKTLFMMIAAAAITFAGCKEDNDETAPVLDVDKTAIAAAHTAGSYPIAVTCNAEWAATVNTDATWCTVQPASGNGDGVVIVNIAENTVIVTRTATITFTADTLTRTVAVTQAAVAPVLEVDRTTIDAAATAGSYPIAVASNATWTVTVNADATWCTVQPESGNGDGVATVNVAENATIETRTTTIIFAAGTLAQQVSVTQAAAPPVLEIDRTTIDAAHTADSYAIAVTSNIAWTATVNVDATWCTLTDANATGNGTVTVNVTENTTTVIRTATVTITAGALTRTVAVEQAGNVTTVSTPPLAASTQIWTFGDQIWSDAIRVPECNKTDFTDSNADPHCRNHTDNDKTWYYYNWPYVHQNADVLCPSPWHVPSASEFITLANNTNAMTLINEWGYGGYAQGSEVGAFTNADYWSSTEYSITHYAQYLVYHNYFISVVTDFKHFGFQVRCVK
jgi:hypothetical protein